MKFRDFFSCKPDNNGKNPESQSVSNATAAMDPVAIELARTEMVERQLRKRDIRSPRVLEAMASVPRHRFVPPEHAANAYTDSPLPIGAGQTISQPYMVAAMADELLLGGNEKVLEVGGGSGYQAAVLSLLVREVIAVEAHATLAEQAHERLSRLEYKNVRVEIGDGSQGWPPDAPYDAILVTAGAPSVPPPLIEQLAEGGRMVIPVGSIQEQTLMRITKREGRVTQESLFACRFVPLLGRYGWPPEALQQPAGE